MTLVALATAADLTLPDEETAAVAEALRALGVGAVIEPWDGHLDWSSADIVVVRSTWDYVHRLEEFLGWVERVAAVTPIANPAPVLRWNAHKGYLADLAAVGVPVVPTWFVPRGSSVTLGSLFTDAAAGAGVSRPAARWDVVASLLPAGDAPDGVVVKPAVSASAYGTARGSVDDPALTAHLLDLVERADVLVQPLVPSVLTDGEISLIHLGGELSHAVRKRPRPGDYRVQGEHGGTVEPHTPTPDELAVASAALTAVPEPCTYARVDLVRGANGPLLMEIELIEPQLFLDQAPGAVERFATAIINRLPRTRPA